MLDGEYMDSFFQKAGYKSIKYVKLAREKAGTFMKKERPLQHFEHDRAREEETDEHNISVVSNLSSSQDENDL